MTDRDRPSTRPSSTTSARSDASAASDDGRAAPSTSLGGRPAKSPSAPAGLTQVSRAHRGLADTEAEERNIMHRLLIASPWQRYQLDRDTAALPGRDDGT